MLTNCLQITFDKQPVPYRVIDLSDCFVYGYIKFSSSDFNSAKPLHCYLLLQIVIAVALIIGM